MTVSRLFLAKLSLLAALVAQASASAAALKSQGTTDYDTEGFTLQLDNANQVATALTAKAHPNAGSAPVGLLLPVDSRSDDGYYALGDITIRMRPVNTGTWTDVASHSKRQPAIVIPAANGNLASADVTPSLSSSIDAASLPIQVVRSWTPYGDGLDLSFNITNTGPDVLEFGGVGIPIPINNNWVGKDQTATWEQSVISDPAPALDAGYVIHNRLTGASPSFVTTPLGKTPLEQYRLNFQNQPNYPAQWLDKTPIDFQYEGVFSWWPATAGLDELDSAAAGSYGFPRGADFNAPTSFRLDPGTSRVLGVRQFCAPGPKAVEDRLTAYGRPTVVGVPGFVVSQNEKVKLLIRSTSAPSITDVEGGSIAFEPVQTVSDGFYSFTGTVNGGFFGRSRVTYSFANGEVGTAHYTIIKPHEAQLDALGEHRFTNSWYTDDSDYFNRAPGIITYDNQDKKIVLDDTRNWVPGMSDEAGSGAYVSAASKLFGRPDPAQVAKLESFATQTIWGQLQHNDPADTNTYGAVKKSLHYYEPSLNGQPGVNYDPTINRGIAWNKAESDRLDRSYNYPHPLVVYWTLYRLARNYEGLVTQQPWNWYLDRCVDTIQGMQRAAGVDNGFAEFGLMEGTYFLRTLEDLKREGSAWSAQANSVETFMKQRADIWNSETYPYASEFPWDNTAQEEVYAWTRYFGYKDVAGRTVETLVAIMASVPHWGYSGTGRDLWDFMYSAKRGPGARLERIFHHYKGSQSALPLMEQFQVVPTDVKMLRAGYGGVIGPLASIQEDGFGSTGFHTRPDYYGWDPLSGDNGVNMALYTLSARSVAVNDASLGGWAGFGADVSQNGNTVNIKPTDGIRQRLFIAPIALYVELDAGKIASATYDTASQAVSITLDAADAHTPNARVRLTTTAQTPSSGTYSVDGSPIEREASVVPLGSGTTVVNLKRA